MSDQAAIVRRVVIRGQVQGVGFRAWAEDMALEFGVGGWVRNRRDGTVEAVLAGSGEAVTQMIEACRRGPPWAKVDRVDVADEANDLLGGQRTTFVVRPTA